ncbi:unnamed protein product, partial [Rotaria sp. Silwood2]
FAFVIGAIDDVDDDYVGADLISLLDVNPHPEHPGIILESEFFDESDFALRYSNIQRRVVSARIANNGMYLLFEIFHVVIFFLIKTDDSNDFKK